MNNKELLPCPFCGGKAKVYKMGMWYYIQCKKCRCMTTQILYEEDINKAWNTRKYQKKQDNSNQIPEVVENGNCKYLPKLTRADIEKMVKFKCNKSLHILYYYIQNEINLAIIYDADENEYTVHAGNTYIHQIKTLKDAKSKVKEIVVNFVCSALGIED